ncbi:hypothetical protein QTG54_003260 [Skeletonema marinoi]|uniref:Uncharacterized protein n=1 Tax=Skeletonema marinoi TaxID=267567 RepID=A0AAD9DIC7_9STRA|nr:hypothetical protein QTG54_003260 [Skeletonema marinoi]|mmetsp:Transcript_2943/g.4793  ORF Transcript_2943/g.4793 Transcript_2943/m.4793 type:complete len:275 (-) Transcript_2943:1000-1824(-)
MSTNDEDVSVKTPKASQINRYQRVLHEYMEHNHSRAFPLNYQFSEDELSTVTPESILKWMNKKICGDADADMLHGDIPTPIRCSHHVLDFYKKSISYFMPNKGQVWDPETKRGNPTRSKDINNLIKKVKEIGDTVEGDQKKRKRDTPSTEPTTIAPPVPQLTLPSAQSAITVPINTAVPTHNAVPVQNVLRRLVAQNSQFIELFGTFSETMKQFQTNLRINNQQILAEINALGSVAPPNLGASAAAASLTNPPQRKQGAKKSQTELGDVLGTSV